jgi:hypothetical protein
VLLSQQCNRSKSYLYVITDKPASGKFTCRFDPSCGQGIAKFTAQAHEQLVAIAPTPLLLTI